jgi:hypothetical protein
MSGGPAQVGEGPLVVQAFAFHQDTLGPLDQGPRVQRHLELLGQHALELSLGRRPEQAGHHPGIDLQGADLTLIPAPRIHRIHIKGPDRATTQLHRTLNPSGSGPRP